MKDVAFRSFLNFSARISAFSTVLLTLVLLAGCGLKSERRSIPAEIESVIDNVGEDMAAGRYDKIYNEASDLWKQDTTLEKSTEFFKTIQSKLGKVENRSLLSATEQQNSGGPLKGRAYIVTYQTTFQNAPGMETFTLVEQDHRWLLARYFVNSTALK
jgi:Protein of unknown function (DUF4019)/Protein of unknown function (DUF3887)